MFFWTIPGAVLVGPALGHLTFPEVIGAYIATGALMLALGLSGWVRRCTEAAPMPIVMAMVAGVFLRFGTGLVHAVRDDFAVALRKLSSLDVVFVGLRGARPGFTFECETYLWHIEPPFNLSRDSHADEG